MILGSHLWILVDKVTKKINMFLLTKSSKCFTLKIPLMLPGLLFCPPQLETTMNCIMKMT